MPEEWRETNSNEIKYFTSLVDNIFYIHTCTFIVYVLVHVGNRILQGYQLN